MKGVRILGVDVGKNSCSVLGIDAEGRVLLDDMVCQWRALDDRITALDEFAEMARNDPAARRLATIPGIGVMNATATTGGKPKLLGSTKRGSKYLRKLIIQGARAALPSLAKTPTVLGTWVRGETAFVAGRLTTV